MVQAKGEKYSYYDVLEIPRIATEAEVNRAFKELCLQRHPERNRELPSEEAEELFQALGEAFAVLSDKSLRARYDQYGEIKGWAYTQNAYELYEKMFGTSNPFAHFGFGEHVKFAPRLCKPPPTKAPPIMKSLECSLEELYNGALKKYDLTRKRPSPTEAKQTTVPSPLVYVDETKTLTIRIEPGWKHGTKLTFPEHADAGPGMIPADVVFSLQELPHKHFKRDGNQLLFTADISLTSALTGTIVKVPTLDGRLLSVSCPEVVFPGYIKTVPGEGMPYKGGKRGDLLISFHIQFPKHLSETQKSVLAKTLSAPSEA